MSALSVMPVSVCWHFVVLKTSNMLVDYLSYLIKQSSCWGKILFFPQINPHHLTLQEHHCRSPQGGEASQLPPWEPLKPGEPVFYYTISFTPTMSLKPFRNKVITHSLYYHNILFILNIDIYITHTTAGTDGDSSNPKCGFRSRTYGTKHCIAWTPHPRCRMHSLWPRGYC